MCKSTHNPKCFVSWPVTMSINPNQSPITQRCLEFSKQRGAEVLRGQELTIVFGHQQGFCTSKIIISINAVGEGLPSFNEKMEDCFHF